MSESAVEPTNDDFPVRENEPDEAVRVHGQDKGHGDRRSKSPTQPSRRRKKSQSHKRSRDRERSHDYEKGESRTVTIKDSGDTTRRPGSEAADSGQDGGHTQRGGTPSRESQAPPAMSSDMLNVMKAEMTSLMKQFVKQSRRKRSRSSSSSSSSSESDSSSSTDSDSDSDHKPRHYGKSRARSRKRRCSRSEGRIPTRRREDSSARGHEAAWPGCKQDGAGSDSDDPFSGLHNAFQAANHSNNESDYTHGFQDTIRDMESFFKTGHKMGDRINDAFASIFSSSLRRRPNDKALLDTADKYPRPVNVPNLVVPKTNDVIWERMRKGPQIVDAHLQKVQTCVSKTLVPMISIMNEIGEGGSNRPASDHAQKITDALRLGCAAFSLLSQVRKEVIRNDLNHTFAKLCAWKYEVGTDQLFSADVVKQLKELTETSRQFNDLTARPSTSSSNHHVDKYRRKTSRAVSRTNPPRASHTRTSTSTAKTKVRQMRYVTVTCQNWQSL